MIDRDLLVAQLIRHEGMKLKPYADSVGKLTIGCGRNLSDNGITTQEALMLLDHDLDDAITDCSTFAWFLRLDAVRQRALVDMRFNMGPNRFRGFINTIAALEDANYRDAAVQMLKSKWADQVGTRAIDLAYMVRTGLDVPPPLIA